MIIVGAGIAGSSLARQARERGHTVMLFDKGDARAAGRYLPSRVFTPKWAPRAVFERSKAWYERNGWLEQRGAFTANFRNTEWKPSADYWTVKSMEPLLEPDYKEELTVTAATSFGPALGPVVLCVGNFTNLFLPKGTAPNKQKWAHWTVSLEVGPIWRELGARLLIYEVLPYKLLLAVNYGDRVAVGAVMQDTQARSITMAHALARAAVELGIVRHGANWHVFGSQRSIYPTDKLGEWAPRQIGEGLYVFSGFASDGYCLAPGYASMFLDELEGAKHVEAAASRV